MKLVDVVEFENFVSFVLEDEGKQVSAQYRPDQLWRDDKDAWHVRRDQHPVHITRGPAKTKPGVSHEMIDALATADTGDQ
jgi:hypothetical protein